MNYNLKRLYEIKGQLRKIKEEKREIEAAFKNQLGAMLMAAFAFIAGLSWREVINSVIDYLFPLDKDTLLAKFIYAIILTFFLSLIYVYVTRFMNKKDDKKEIEDIKQ